MKRCLTWGLALVMLLGACAEGGTAPDGDARLAIAVAPLTLPGVTDVCYGLTVTNGLSEVVWSRDGVCADNFGDGAGAVSYVGACDASAGAERHTVALVIEGVWDAAGQLPTSSYQDPGMLTRQVTCAANADTAVTFELTIMRRAQQGFFDVAVTFDDLFCSAKVDCTDDQNVSHQLLFNEAGARDTTVVAALACTEGVGGAGTHLYRSNLVIDCPDPFVDLALDPSEGPGNAYATASTGPIFQYAVYEGTEALTSGGDAISKHYWNVAIGLDLALLPDGCRLVGLATASDGPLTDGTTPGDAAYPVIDFNVTLTGGGALVCRQHALDSDDVVTRYATPASPETFAHVFDGAQTTPILNGTGLFASDPGVTCATILTDHPASGDGVYWVDPDGAGGDAPAAAYCDMTTDGGGWTQLFRVNALGCTQYDSQDVFETRSSFGTTTDDNFLPPYFYTVPFSEAYVVDEDHGLPVVSTAAFAYATVNDFLDTLDPTWAGTSLWRGGARTYLTLAATATNDGRFDDGDLRLIFTLNPATIPNMLSPQVSSTSLAGETQLVMDSEQGTGARRFNVALQPVAGVALDQRYQLFVR